MALPSFVSLGLGLVSAAFPAAAPVIAIFERVEPYIEEGLPLIKAAISEGPAAFSAAKVAAPELFSQLGQFASALKGDPSALVSDAELAVLSAHIAGIDPPGWTHEETQRWWDRAQGPT